MAEKSVQKTKFKAAETILDTWNQQFKLLPRKLCIVPRTEEQKKQEHECTRWISGVCYSLSMPTLYKVQSNSYAKPNFCTIKQYKLLNKHPPHLLHFLVNFTEILCLDVFACM